MTRAKLLAAEFSTWREGYWQRPLTVTVAFAFWCHDRGLSGPTRARVWAAYRSLQEKA